MKKTKCHVLQSLDDCCVCHQCSVSLDIIMNFQLYFHSTRFDSVLCVPVMTVFSSKQRDQIDPTNPSPTILFINEFKQGCSLRQRRPDQRLLDQRHPCPAPDRSCSGLVGCRSKDPCSPYYSHGNPRQTERGRRNYPCPYRGRS